jgi:hypothetical protein
VRNLTQALIGGGIGLAVLGFGTRKQGAKIKDRSFEIGAPEIKDSKTGVGNEIP